MFIDFEYANKTKSHIKIAYKEHLYITGSMKLVFFEFFITFKEEIKDMTFIVFEYSLWYQDYQQRICDFLSINIEEIKLIYDKIYFRG